MDGSQSEQHSLIDVLSVPTIGEQVLKHLRGTGFSQFLRQACSATREQVDRHVDNMTIRITQPAQQLEIAKKLAQKGLQPRKLYLSSCGSREAATQPLVSDEFRHMLGRVNDLTLFHTQSLTEEMLQGVARNMATLAHLTTNSGEGGHHIQLLAVVSLPLLNSLSLHDMCMQHACFLQPLTQLQALSLSYRNKMAGIAALTTLTGLTRLKLDSMCFEEELSAAEQLELGSTLAALQNLQRLTINHVSPGPVMEAVWQLTKLTKLELSCRDRVSIFGLTTSQCLALLPGHITDLHLFFCPNSLAQLAALRSLTLKQCMLGAALLEHLLSTATQGSALEIKLVHCSWYDWEAPAVDSVTAKIAAQRGSKNTPRVSVECCYW